MARTQDDKYKKPVDTEKEWGSPQRSSSAYDALLALREQNASYWSQRETLTHEEKEFGERMAKRSTDPTFGESLTTGMFGRERGGLGLALPFWSTGQDVAHLGNLIESVYAAEKGVATRDQLDQLEDFQDWQYRQQFAGPGAIAGAIAGETGAFVGEFVTGAKAWTMIAKTGASKAAKSFFKKYIGRNALLSKTMQAGGGDLTKATLTPMGKGASLLTPPVTALSNPQKWANSLVNGVFKNSTRISDAGGWTFGAGAKQQFAQNLIGETAGVFTGGGGRTRLNAYANWLTANSDLQWDESLELAAGMVDDPEGWLKQIGAGFIDDYIEMWSEVTGEVLTSIVAGGHAARFKRYVESAGKKQATNRLRKMGWSGFLEEMGEEAIGATAREVVGQVGPEALGAEKMKGSLEEFLDPDNFMGTAMGLALAGSGMRVGAWVTSSGKRISNAASRELHNTTTAAGGAKFNNFLVPKGAQGFLYAASYQANLIEGKALEAQEQLPEGETPESYADKKAKAELAQDASDVVQDKDAPTKLRDKIAALDPATAPGADTAEIKKLQGLKDAALDEMDTALERVHTDSLNEPLPEVKNVAKVYNADVRELGFSVTEELERESPGANARVVPAGKLTEDQTAIVELGRKLGTRVMFVSGSQHLTPASLIDIEGGGSVAVFNQAMIEDMGAITMRERNLGFRAKDFKNLSDEDKQRITKIRMHEYLFHEVVHEAKNRHGMPFINELLQVMETHNPDMVKFARTTYRQFHEGLWGPKEFEGKEGQELLDEETLAVVAQALHPFMQTMAEANNIRVFDEILDGKDEGFGAAVVNMLSAGSRYVPFVNIDTAAIRRIRKKLGKFAGQESQEMGSKELEVGALAARELMRAFLAPTAPAGAQGAEKTEEEKEAERVSVGEATGQRTAEGQAAQVIGIDGPTLEETIDTGTGEIMGATKKAEPKEAEPKEEEPEEEERTPAQKKAAARKIVTRVTKEMNEQRRLDLEERRLDLEQARLDREEEAEARAKKKEEEAPEPTTRAAPGETMLAWVNALGPSRRTVKDLTKGMSLQQLKEALGAAGETAPKGANKKVLAELLLRRVAEDDAAKPKAEPVARKAAPEPTAEVDAAEASEALDAALAEQEAELDDKIGGTGKFGKEGLTYRDVLEAESGSETEEHLETLRRGYDRKREADQPLMNARAEALDAIYDMRTGGVAPAPAPVKKKGRTSKKSSAKRGTRRKSAAETEPGEAVDAAKTEEETGRPVLGAKFEEALEFANVDVNRLVKETANAPDTLEVKNKKTKKTTTVDLKGGKFGDMTWAELYEADKKIANKAAHATANEARIQVTQTTSAINKRARKGRRTPTPKRTEVKGIIPGATYGQPEIMYPKLDPDFDPDAPEVPMGGWGTGEAKLTAEEKASRKVALRTLRAQLDLGDRAVQRRTFGDWLEKRKAKAGRRKRYRDKLEAMTRKRLEEEVRKHNARVTERGRQNREAKANNRRVAATGEGEVMPIVPEGKRINLKNNMATLKRALLEHRNYFETRGWSLTDEQFAEYYDQNERDDLPSAQRLVDLPDPVLADYARLFWGLGHGEIHSTTYGVRGGKMIPLHQRILMAILEAQRFAKGKRALLEDLVPDRFGAKVIEGVKFGFDMSPTGGFGFSRGDASYTALATTDVLENVDPYFHDGRGGVYVFWPVAQQETTRQGKVTAEGQEGWYVNMPVETGADVRRNTARELADAQARMTGTAAAVEQLSDLAEQRPNDVEIQNQLGAMVEEQAELQDALLERTKEAAQAYEADEKGPEAMALVPRPGKVLITKGRSPEDLSSRRLRRLLKKGYTAVVLENPDATQSNRDPNAVYVYIIDSSVAIEASLLSEIGAAEAKERERALLEQDIESDEEGPDEGDRSDTPKHRHALSTRTYIEGGSGVYSRAEDSVNTLLDSGQRYAFGVNADDLVGKLLKKLRRSGNAPVPAEVAQLRLAVLIEANAKPAGEDAPAGQKLRVDLRKLAQNISDETPRVGFGAILGWRDQRDSRWRQDSTSDLYDGQPYPIEASVLKYAETYAKKLVIVGTVGVQPRHGAAWGWEHGERPGEGHPDEYQYAAGIGSQLRKIMFDPMVEQEPGSDTEVYQRGGGEVLGHARGFIIDIGGGREAFYIHEIQSDIINALHHGDLDPGDPAIIALLGQHGITTKKGGIDAHAIYILSIRMAATWAAENGVKYIALPGDIDATRTASMGAGGLTTLHIRQQGQEWGSKRTPSWYAHRYGPPGAEVDFTLEPDYREGEGGVGVLRGDAHKWMLEALGVYLTEAGVAAQSLEAPRGPGVQSETVEALPVRTRAGEDMVLEAQQELDSWLRQIGDLPAPLGFNRALLDTHHGAIQELENIVNAVGDKFGVSMYQLYRARDNRRLAGHAEEIVLPGEGRMEEATMPRSIAIKTLEKYEAVQNVVDAHATLDAAKYRHGQLSSPLVAAVYRLPDPLTKAVATTPRHALAATVKDANISRSLQGRRPLNANDRDFGDVESLSEFDVTDQENVIRERMALLESSKPSLIGVDIETDLGAEIATRAQEIDRQMQQARGMLAGRVRNALTPTGNMATAGPTTALLPGHATDSWMVLLDKYLANGDESIFEADRVAKVIEDRLWDTVDTSLSPSEQDKQMREREVAMLLHMDLRNAATMKDEEVRPDGGIPTQQEIFDHYKGRLSQEQRETYALSQNLPANVQSLVEEIIKRNDAIGEVALSNGIINGKHEVYAARMWFRQGKSAVGGLIEPVKAGGPFALTARGRQIGRKYKSILQGWAAGERLSIPSATEAQRVATRQVAEAIHNTALITAMMKTGIAKEIGNTEKEPEGYSRLNRNVRQFDGMVVPTELAKLLNTITSRVDYESLPFGAPLKMAVKLNAIVKQTILTFSFFHHQAFLRSFLFTIPGSALRTETAGTGGVISGAVKSAGLALGVVPRADVEASAERMRGYRAGAEAIKQRHPLLVELVRAGLTVASKQDYDVMAEQDFMDWTAKGEKFLGSEFLGEQYGKFRRTQARATRWLFNNMGAHLKTQAALLEFEHLLNKHASEIARGEVQRSDLARWSAEKTNADFGGINLRRMTGKASKGPRHANTQLALRIFFLAPDWTESNFITARKAILSGDNAAEGAVYRGMWTNVAMRTMIPTLMFNFLMAGFDWDQFVENTEDALKAGEDTVAGGLHKGYWMDMNMTPFANQLNQWFGDRAVQAGSDKYFSWIGHFADPIKWSMAFLPGGKGIMQPAKGKMSPLARTVGSLFSGEDWAGRQYTHFDAFLGQADWRDGDPTGKQAGKLNAFLPFSERGKIGSSQLPSFILERIASSAPIQLEALVSFLMAEDDGFTMVGRALGLKIHQTYPDDTGE